MKSVQVKETVDQGVLKSFIPLSKPGNEDHLIYHKLMLLLIKMKYLISAISQNWVLRRFL